MRVVHFMRHPRPTALSIERVYEDVREALPSDIHVVKWACRYPSSGIFPRLRDAWAARGTQGDVNHVTGDAHYLTFFLDSRRTVLTVHDLVSLERMKGVKRLLFWLFWYWLPVARSRVVVTISESTRQALIRSLRCRPEKIVVVHNPVSQEFRQVPKQFQTDRPRILQVGTKENKNVGRVIAALEGIRCTLVIIGELTEEQMNLLGKHRLEYENHVGLSREDLLAEYVSADMLVFASTCEGFGLPIVEANAVGRPVVTSCISSMPEVAGEGACLVDPNDVMSIRNGITKVISDEVYRRSIVAAGYKNALRFRAEDVALKYASIYEQFRSRHIQ